METIENMNTRGHAEVEIKIFVFSRKATTTARFFREKRQSMVAVLAHAKPATFLSSSRRAEVGGRFRPKTQRGWAFGRSGPEVGPHMT